MKSLIEYLVKNIVNYPDDVDIKESAEESSRIYTVSVNPDDMGIVIGRQGQTIRSVRNIAKIKAIKDKLYIDIKLLETEKEQSDHSAPDS